MARQGENIRKRKDGRWKGLYIKARTGRENAVGLRLWHGLCKQVLVQKKAEAVFYNLKRTNLTIEALAEVCVGKFDTSQGLLLFGLESGLRIGEICGLQWSDFDPKLGKLKINRAVCRIFCGKKGDFRISYPLLARSVLFCISRAIFALFPNQYLFIVMYVNNVIDPPINSYKNKHRIIDSK